jgi:2'-5' RNA ligase
MAVQKYFIAIILPSPVYEKAEVIKQELYADHGLKGALRSPAHITLHRPFQWKEEKEGKLVEGLAAFRSGLHPTIQLSGFDVFDDRVIFINLKQDDELAALHTALALHCKRNLLLFNEADDSRGFRPHVTIASRDLKKNKFNELWPAFRERPFEEQFKCAEFHLLKLASRWELLDTFKI